MSPLLRDNQARQVRYCIADPYFRFWPRFVSTVQMQALAEAGMWPRMITFAEAALPTFLGHTLKQWWNWDVGAEFRISIKRPGLQGLRP